MVRLEKPFLAVDEDADKAQQGNRSAKVCWVVAAAAMTVAAFVGGTEFGRQTPRSQAAYGMSLTLGNGTSKIATALSEAFRPDHYPYTGGTCSVDPCYNWRNAKCRKGYCVCGEGASSGVDGKCYQGVYRPVVLDFTLTNAKYTTQKMYMPAASPLNSVKTTGFPSSFNGGKDKFTLYQLPGKDASGQKGYFLSTERFPDSVVAVRATAGTAFSPFGAYEVGFAKAFSPQRLAVRVCSKGDGNVMISGQSLLGTTEWLYIHHLSWIVYGYSLGDPGDSGVWKADPPLPEDGLDGLEPCDFNKR